MSENVLSAKQARAVSALLTENSIIEAAAAAGVDTRTITRWLKLPAFQAALGAAESELIDGATRRLLRLQDQALATVERLLSDDPDSKVADSVRLRAALAALEHLIKLRSLRDVERRLQQLEERGQAVPVDWLSEFFKGGAV